MNVVTNGARNIVINGVEYGAKTGRTASYVIAASDAPAIWKAQADYVMPAAASDLGAIANAAFASNKTVRLSEGNFQVTTTITIPSSSSLVGSGWWATVVTLKADVDLIVLTADTIGMAVMDMTLLGDSSAYAATSHAIQARGSSSTINRCIFKNLDIQDFKGSAFDLYDVQDSYFENIQIDTCGDVTGTTYSLSMAGNSARGSINNQFVGLTIQAAPYRYIYLDAYSAGNQFNAVKLDSLAVTTADIGVYITSTGNRFLGGIAYIYQLALFKVEGANGTKNVIRDWTCTDSHSPVTWGSNGVWLVENAATYNAVVNCSFSNFQRPLTSVNQYATFRDNTVLSSGDVDLLLDTGSDYTTVTGNKFLGANGVSLGTGTHNQVYKNVPYIASGESRFASGSLVPTGTCTATTVSGTFTESPLALKPGANTMTCTASGTINVVCPAGSTAIVTSGDSTVTDSPKTCPAGATTLVTVTTGAGADTFTITVHHNAFAWHNPEAQDIFIKKIVINRTAAGGTATAEINVGIADNGTVDDPGTEFFENLLANNAAALHDSYVAAGTSYGTQTIWVNCQDSASATGGWIVGKLDTEIANALAGTFIVEYCGKP